MTWSPTRHSFPAALALALFCAHPCPPPGGQDSPETLAVHTLRSGDAYAVVREAGGTLAVTMDRSGDVTILRAAPGLLPSDEDLGEVHVAPWLPELEYGGAVLALATRRDDVTTYRYAIARADAEDWDLSGPVVTAAGEPYRVVEIRAQGDRVELTLRRGRIAVRGTSTLDELVFVDDCTLAGTEFRGGKSGLTDVLRSEEVPLGSRR